MPDYRGDTISRMLERQRNGLSIDIALTVVFWDNGISTKHREAVNRSNVAVEKLTVMAWNEVDYRAARGGPRHCKKWLTKRIRCGIT